MIVIGIDIGKLKHTFSIYNSSTGEVLAKPSTFNNDKDGYEKLIQSFKSHSKSNILIGMEDTGHYHFTLLKYLLSKHYNVALINPVATDMLRKMQGGVSKTDNLDSLTICDILASNSRNKAYRISKVNRFDLYEQKQLTRHHHNLKEELQVYKNRLQKCIDIVFPEYNSLFPSKYSIVYMDILKKFGSADKIAHTDIRTLRNCFEYKGKGKRISLSAKELKAAATNSVGIISTADEIQIRHLIGIIELIEDQLKEIDKKIEEFSVETNSPILSIPGISHFSGTSILAELGDIGNYSKASKIIKFAGVSPRKYESSQFQAQHCAISKQGSEYLRKTLYQIILPIIQHNEVFKNYYNLKRSQGKSHRCAQGHCVRKLLRIIFHLLKTNQQFDSALLK